MSKKLQKCDICQDKVIDLYETNSKKMACGDCFASEYLKTFDENDDTIFENPDNIKLVKPRTKPVTIRLNEMDIQIAKKIAQEKNTPYQTLLKEIIHNNLASNQ